MLHGIFPRQDLPSHCQLMALHQEQCMTFQLESGQERLHSLNHEQGYGNKLGATVGTWEIWVLTRLSATRSNREVLDVHAHARVMCASTVGSSGGRLGRTLPRYERIQPAGLAPSGCCGLPACTIVHAITRKSSLKWLYSASASR